MALTKLTTNLAIIAALSDLPNATDGLTAAQLKAKFDEGPIDIKTFINNTLTVELDTALTAKQPSDSTLTALAAFNTNGLMKQTSADTFVAVTAPSGAVVGDTDSQTLTNKTLTSPNINSPTVTSPTQSTTLSTITVDGTVIGEWAVAAMAASCAVYDVVYLSSTGYNKAKADADATLPSVGMCIETGTGARKVLKKGYVKNNAWSWTTGQLLYVSTTSAGALTSTLPSVAGNRVQIIGYAEATTIIYFNPDYTFVQV